MYSRIKLEIKAAARTSVVEYQILTTSYRVVETTLSRSDAIDMPGQISLFCWRCRLGRRKGSLFRGSKSQGERIIVWFLFLTIGLACEHAEWAVSNVQAYGSFQAI